MRPEHGGGEIHVLGVDGEEPLYVGGVESFQFPFFRQAARSIFLQRIPEGDDVLFEDEAHSVQEGVLAIGEGGGGRGGGKGGGGGGGGGGGREGRRGGEGESGQGSEFGRVPTAVREGWRGGEEEGRR